MEIPTIASYNSTEINHDLCLGRRTEPDRRWSPHVFRGYQCTKKPVEGNLCHTCFRRSTNESTEWCGQVDEDLPPACHVAGSDWFLKKLDEGKLKFNGVIVSRVADTQQVAGQEEPIDETTMMKEKINRLEKELAEEKAANDTRRSQLVDIMLALPPEDCSFDLSTVPECIQRLVEKLTATEATNQDLRTQLVDMKNYSDSCENAAVERGRLLKEQREAILNVFGIQNI